MSQPSHDPGDDTDPIDAITLEGQSPLDIDEEPAATPGRRPGKATTATVIANTSLRAEPRSDAEIVSLLPKDATVTLHEQADAYQRVTFNGQPGWVHTAFLEIA